MPDHGSGRYSPELGDPPWKDWISEIDSDALSYLVHYRREHPESRFSKFLAKIRVPIDACGDDVKACIVRRQDSLPSNSI